MGIRIVNFEILVLLVLVNAQALRLESNAARSKLKGIGGNLNKWWNMWFNASILAKPYLLLIFGESNPKGFVLQVYKIIKQKLK